MVAFRHHEDAVLMWTNRKTELAWETVILPQVPRLREAPSPCFPNRQGKNKRSGQLSTSL